MYDVIIVGAGPAGLTAGLYAGRAGLSALILERVFAGGQITRTLKVENFPGFPEGVQGIDLSLKLKEQAERHGAVIETAEAIGFELEGDEKKVITIDNVYTAKSVVLAMGASYKALGLGSERRLVGSGVSYCATCDGAFFRNKDVAVIGGGDTAIEDALYLSHVTNRVYVVHRRDELRAQHVLQKAALQNSKIEFLWNSEVDAIVGDSFVTGVRIRNNKTQDLNTLNVSGVFVAIGTEPHSNLILDLVKTDEFGYIITDETMHTSIPGVFAAGDIVAKPLRQVVTAAADGAVAIYSALSYLREKE